MAHTANEVNEKEESEQDFQITLKNEAKMDCKLQYPNCSQTH